MDNFVDYYELLHVQPSAPEPVIKASYRTMMQKLNHHPDRGGDVGFAQLLNDAVGTLCNPRTRAVYDALRKQYISPPSQNWNDTQTGPDTAPSSWGEPGGSPDTGYEDEATQSEQARARSKNNPYDGHHDNYPSLPAKPQCPFCHALYPSDDIPVVAPSSYNESRRCHGCNGARTPIAHLPYSSNQELRKMHRQHHETPARMWLEWPSAAPQSSALSDFSPVGCALIYPTAVKLNATVMIETGLFNAICDVRHCKSSARQGFLIGLEFITLDMLAAPGALLNATA